MATAGKIIVAGEITAKELPDIPAIVCRTVRETGYDCNYEVEVITHEQSGDIAGAVSKKYALGAGDQGIVYGYACNETNLLLPMPVVLANRLTRLLTNARRTEPSKAWDRTAKPRYPWSMKAVFPNGSQISLYPASMINARIWNSCAGRSFAR